jgi:hypothetical protein
MLRFTPGVAGGLAIGVAAAVATILTILPAPHFGEPVKADRLQANVAASPGEKRIAIVEVVGVRDAAIVYRDREGRELFRTDPVANVTIVTKNLALPEVTVRENAQSQVERVPVEKTRAPGGDKPLPPQGCESGLSPDLSPTVPTGKDRCIVELAPASTRASLQ